MDFQPVSDAYSSASAQYIDLFDRGWKEHDDDTELVRRHLTGLPGPVLDLGCGPGHWTALLHSLGAHITGIDMVPEFIAHAKSAHPGPNFQLGSMTDPDLPAHSVAGILSWYSTIHVPPAELDSVLALFRRLLQPSGMLVIGFFDNDHVVERFDHQVAAAYRWPVDIFSQRLGEAGFTEVQRVRHELPNRPDRKYAAIAARAS